MDIGYTSFLWFCFFITVLVIYNLIACGLFSVARPARHIMGGVSPHAARRSGRLRGVRHGFALRAMSLRDGIPLPDNGNLHRTMPFLVKITMFSTVA